MFLVGQEGVDVNAKDGPSGHSPLHRACIAGQTRQIKVRNPAYGVVAFGAFPVIVLHTRYYVFCGARAGVV